jgi:hypothetical protein
VEATCLAPLRGQVQRVREGGGARQFPPLELPTGNGPGRRNSAGLAVKRQAARPSNAPHARLEFPLLGPRAGRWMFSRPGCVGVAGSPFPSFPPRGAGRQGRQDKAAGAVFLDRWRPRPRRDSGLAQGHLTQRQLASQPSKPAQAVDCAASCDSLSLFPRRGRRRVGARAVASSLPPVPRRAFAALLARSGAQRTAENRWVMARCRATRLRQPRAASRPRRARAPSSWSLPTRCHSGAQAGW